MERVSRKQGALIGAATAVIALAMFRLAGRKVTWQRGAGLTAFVSLAGSYALGSRRQYQGPPPDDSEEVFLEYRWRSLQTRDWPGIRSYERACTELYRLGFEPTIEQVERFPFESIKEAQLVDDGNRTGLYQLHLFAIRNFDNEACRNFCTMVYQDLWSERGPCRPYFDESVRKQFYDTDEAVATLLRGPYVPDHGPLLVEHALKHHYESCRRLLRNAISSGDMSLFQHFTSYAWIRAFKGPSSERGNLHPPPPLLTTEEAIALLPPLKAAFSDGDQVEDAVYAIAKQLDYGDLGDGEFDTQPLQELVAQLSELDDGLTQEITRGLAHHLFNFMWFAAYALRDPESNCDVVEAGRKATVHRIKRILTAGDLLGKFQLETAGEDHRTSLFLSFLRAKDNQKEDLVLGQATGVSLAIIYALKPEKVRKWIRERIASGGNGIFYHYEYLDTIKRLVSAKEEKRLNEEMEKLLRGVELEDWKRRRCLETIKRKKK